MFHVNSNVSPLGMKLGLDALAIVYHTRIIELSQCRTYGLEGEKFCFLQYFSH